jgi:hypothetical protein
MLYALLWIRIRIRIDLAVLDPDTDPYGDTDPDPGAWKLTELTNCSGFLDFKEAFVPS